MDPKLSDQAYRMFGIRAVMSAEERKFAEQCQELLNDQWEAIEAGDYEKANALGSMAQNMALIMVVNEMIRGR